MNNVSTDLPSENEFYWLFYLHFLIFKDYSSANHETQILTPSFIEEDYTNLKKIIRLKIKENKKDLTFEDFMLHLNLILQKLDLDLINLNQLNANFISLSNIQNNSNNLNVENSNLNSNNFQENNFNKLNLQNFNNFNNNSNVNLNNPFSGHLNDIRQNYFHQNLHLNPFNQILNNKTKVENIIKENIRTGNEQLLSLDQFKEFVDQNDKLNEEVLNLEIEKKSLLEDYNNLLRDNLNLRSKDESFELEKIKDALEEISLIGNLQKEAELKISSLQKKFKDLNQECTDLTQQIKLITKNLESLNIDNVKLGKELALINKELYYNKKRMNKSFTESINEDDTKFPYLYSKEENFNVNLSNLNIQKIKKNKHTKTTFM